MSPATILNQDEVLAVLNKILEAELAGVVRYMHYSLMIFGHNRIPIVSWLRSRRLNRWTMRNKRAN